MRVGVDLGGTKIEVIALDGEGNARLRRRRPSPRGDDPERRYADILRAIAELVQGAIAEVGAIPGVGVGTPGALSPRTGLLGGSNTTCLNGRPLREDLERVLGLPVRLRNDADCFALSEAVDGAAAGAASVFGVILGTGVGGGIVIEGRLLEGPNAICGEWGHNGLPRPSPEELPGPPCYCGHRGCIESWLSGPGLAADHLRVEGEVRSALQIAEGAAFGEAACERSLGRYEERLARALASVINLLDPEVIVLGGGLSQIERLYDRVPSLWAAQVFRGECRTRLLPAQHGDSGGVRGAAWLWPDSAEQE